MTKEHIMIRRLLLSGAALLLLAPASMAQTVRNVNPSSAPTPCVYIDTTAGDGSASTACARAVYMVDPVTGVPATVSASTHGQTTALAASKVLKASAGKLFTLDVIANDTLTAATWYVLVFDAVSLPADGAVTPAKCYSVPSGVPTFTAGWPSGGVAMTTGITVGVSTTGCFTKTASTNALFIGGDFQ